MPKYTLPFLILAFLIGSFFSFAQTVFPHDTRSDSIDVKHYDIHIDLRDFSIALLKGETKVVFKPLVNGISEIRLDLRGLTVDSIKDPNGNMLTYTLQSHGFTTDLGAVFNTGDSTSVVVYYHGTPIVDPHFGGFYFEGGYAYNLGVSLDTIPHNYGKTWFPCFDNFTTRSTVDLFVTVLPQHSSVGGGVLQSTVTNPDLSKTEHWKINQLIPSYLVSAAASSYVFVEDEFTNILNQPVPVLLAAQAQDTTNMKNSFTNLEEAFNIFESKWGLYRWDRVGYAMTTKGAMEHAMNIAYPVFAIDGTTGLQNVMAHELGHHWWGNLVTCRTAEDMWINEGSASYCQYVFIENLEDRAAYERDVRNAHKDLLQTCHMTDQGYWPLSGMPQEHTYGVTTYTKGADIIHSLRGYLGDVQFFNGLRTMLEQNQFSDMDAIEYRNDLSAITGVNLDNFFADWIFQGGWPHVSIDSVKAVPSGVNYSVTVHLKQKLVGRTNYSHQVPVTLTLRDNAWETFEQTVYADGETNAVTVTVPFLPSLAYLNRDELISHAVTAGYQTYSTTGTKQLPHANMTLQIQSVTDSAFVVVEHHWAAPDPIVNNMQSWTISPQRFWRVDGIWPAGFTTNATLRYSGQLSGGNAYLDHLLIMDVEDSLILLYRPDRATDWVEFDTYSKTMGNVNDKTGTVAITGLRKGEYTFAMKGQLLGTNTLKKQHVKIHPNPVTDVLTISSQEAMEMIILTNIQGGIVYQRSVAGTAVQIDTNGFPSGAYLLSGYAKEHQLFTEKIVIE